MEIPVRLLVADRSGIVHEGLVSLVPMGNVMQAEVMGIVEEVDGLVAHSPQVATYSHARFH